MDTRLLKIILLLGLLFTQTTFAASNLFNISVKNNNQLSITTNIPNHTYSNAGIRINTSGYTLGTECTKINNGYCIFSANNTSPTIITLQGPSGVLNVNICLDGTGPISCQNYNATIKTFASPRYAYIGSYTASTLSMCNVDPNTGALTGCGSTGSGFSGPIAVAFNANETLAYVANFSNNNVSLCNVNTTSGILSGCTTTGPAINGPTWITLNSAGTLAYVVSYSDNLVYKCTLDQTTGALGTCTGTGSGFNGPQQMVFNNAGTFAYIGNWNEGIVSLCSVASGTGNLTCVSSGETFFAPPGVTLSPNGIYAYVTDEIANAAVQCQINQTNGTLSHCNTTGSGFVSPDAITTNAAGTLAYIANYGANSVSLCRIDSTTGNFNSCAATGSGFGSFTAGITLYY